MRIITHQYYNCRRSTKTTKRTELLKFLKITSYVYYRSPVLQLKETSEDDGGGDRNLKINLYVRYGSPVLQLEVATEEDDGAGLKS